MKIYAVIIDDTHADTDVKLFSTPEAAIEFAKKEAVEGAGQYVDDIDVMDIDGYLYYAQYSPESNVCVLEREVGA